MNLKREMFCKIFNDRATLMCARRVFLNILYQLVTVRICESNMFQKYKLTGIESSNNEFTNYKKTMFLVTD